MTVCWVGLGHMGLPMASRLTAAGIPVTGFDLAERTRRHAAAAGLSTTETLAEAAAGADVVITMLPAGAHVRTVLMESGLDGLTAPGALYLDTSSIGPGETRALGADIAATGRTLVDAPVSGGIAGAAAGTLTFMVGASGDLAERVRPILEPMASRIFPLGGLGAGQSAKLVNNLMLAVNMAGVAEATVLAGRLGLDHRTLLDLVAVSSGDSWVLRNFYPVAGVVDGSPADRDFRPGFAAGLMRKDVGLAIEASDLERLPARMTRLAAALLDELVDAVEGEPDFSALAVLAAGDHDPPTNVPHTDMNARS